MNQRYRSMVLLSPDPHALFRKVVAFQRRWSKVRVEASLLFPEVYAGIFPYEGQPESKKETARAQDAFCREFSKYLLPGGEGMSLPVVVVRTLARRKLHLAIAESCTGGTIADLLTMVPGSSKVLEAAVVSYSNRAKEHLLGVKRVTLLRHGAVSSQVVREMLVGAAAIAGVECAVATSGIAGPSGGSLRKPVGLVYCGAMAGGRSVTRKYWLAAIERQDFKILASFLAMRLLLDLVEALPSSSSSPASSLALGRSIQKPLSGPPGSIISATSLDPAAQ